MIKMTVWERVAVVERRGERNSLNIKCIINVINVVAVSIPCDYSLGSLTGLKNCPRKSRFIIPTASRLCVDLIHLPLLVHLLNLVKHSWKSRRRRESSSEEIFRNCFFSSLSFFLFILSIYSYLFIYLYFLIYRNLVANTLSFVLHLIEGSSSFNLFWENFLN